MSKKNKKPNSTGEKFMPIVRNPIILALHVSPKRGGAHGSSQKAKRQNARQLLRQKLKDHDNLDSILSNFDEN